MTGLDELIELFSTDGAAAYFGEEVTQAEHMLQAAAIAEDRAAPDALVVAALLHDVGHFHGALRGGDLVAGRDNHHAEAGASVLERWFGPEVTEPVRLHVEAKRYLCATEPEYLARLSAASVDSLAVQGGPMSPTEAAAFAGHPGSTAAIELRRIDDDAKDPDRVAPPIGHFVALIRQLATNA